MKRYFEKYKRFLGTIFLLWLFFRIAAKFGFGFGVDLRLFFRVFFWLFWIYLVWEIKIRWPVIYPVIKASFLKVRDEFTLKTETTKKEIISSSPRIFAGKTGNSLVLTLAVILSLFSFFWQFSKALSRFFLQPSTLLVLAILGILTDIFVFDFTSDVIILILAGLWVWVIWHYKFKGEVSISGALVFLIMCPFLLVFKKDLVAEKAAVWAYMFLVVGTIQLFLRHLKEERQDAKTEK